MQKDALLPPFAFLFGFQTPGVQHSFVARRGFQRARSPQVLVYAPLEASDVGESVDGLGRDEVTVGVVAADGRRCVAVQDATKDVDDGGEAVALVRSQVPGAAQREQRPLIGDRRFLHDGDGRSVLRRCRSGGQVGAEASRCSSHVGC